ncbi:rhoGAP domain-containing protein [Ditylenchus destructor]|uniref:RhoGAP domain-containing protein n=1 Tax=Ditylenchus destructor TaxID=166010 RepID=A0AAD4R8L8_9BILA|nr:rhoGAP domain-containing protein [Ditylenchus destructor]
MNFSSESPLLRTIGHPQLSNGCNGTNSSPPSSESVIQNGVRDTMASSSTNSNDDFAKQNHTNAIHQTQISALRDSSVDEWRRQMLHNANDLAALSVPEVRRRPRPKCLTTSLKLNDVNNTDDSYTTNILVSKVRADAKAKIENHLNIQDNRELPSIDIMINNWKQGLPESCASEGGVDISPSSPSIASVSLTSSSHATSPSFISSPDGYFAHHYSPTAPSTKNGPAFDDSDVSFSSTNALYAINPCSSSSLSSIYQTPKPVAQMNSSCIENETESAIPCSKQTGLFSPKPRISKATSLQSFNSSSMSPLLSSARYLDFAQQEITFDIIDLQSVLAMEWLRNTALVRLTKMVDQTVVEKSQEKQRQKRLSVLKSLRRSIRQRVEAKDDINAAKFQENACKESSGLYGAPLSEISSKTDDGNPLPRFVTDIMEFLMLNAANAEGIFRKNGVKLRIEEIKLRCSKLNPNDPIPEDLLSKSQLHDLADSLKQYFRLLPECLMTHSVSIMLENAISELPTDKHFLAINYCMLLLPTENRQSLQLLLKFLYLISRHSSTNQVCVSYLVYE